MIAPEVSRALSRRVMMSRSAAANAPSTGSSAAQLQGAPAGPGGIPTPPTPANTACPGRPGSARLPAWGAWGARAIRGARPGGGRVRRGGVRVEVFDGFGGVVCRFVPWGAPWRWAALLPVVGACAAALRDIITRRLSARETSGAIMFYSMALMVACASLSAPFGWRWPDPLDLLLFLAVGFLVGGAHTLMIEGIRLCEVSLIAPLKYVMILYSIGYGALIWHDLPSLQALLGTAIVVASGVFIVRRQAQARGSVVGVGSGSVRS